MPLADWIVLSLYLGGTLSIGLVLGKLVKSTSDLFAAGRKSPWWMSGLSAFMTMFSANTFVVWGGIAFEHGLVAVVINLCYGIAALLAGYTVAGLWNRLDIRTPGEYIEKRFGKNALYFFTGFMMLFRIVSTGGALYAIAVLTLAVIGGEAPGSTELNTAILTFAVIIIAYTMVGGLWAVLLTDTLQFIILNVAVLFVVAMLLSGESANSSLIQDAPEGFFNLSTARYTWLFLAGWVAIHYFMIGADWAFVQRYICVKSPSEARKGTFLFAALYLVSPILWLLPPLLWRLQNPVPPNTSPAELRALAESAYILSCKSVLPLGMLGLMIAAMFSATASMISSQLNVFSSVLTNDFYRGIFKRNASEKHYLYAGRIITVILGCVMAAIALLTPYLGGAAKLIIGVTQVMVTPLLAPSLLALFIPKLDARAIWITVGVCFPLGLISQFTNWLDGSIFSSVTVTGVILPIVLTLLTAFISKSPKGQLKFRRTEATHEKLKDTTAARLPLIIIAWCLIATSLILFCLIPLNTEHWLSLTLAAVLMALPATIGLRKLNNCHPQL